MYKLFSKTPREYKDRASDINVKLKTFKNGRYYYRTLTKSSGNEHNQVVMPLKKGGLKNVTDDAIVLCDCGNFIYENEWLLWKKNASRLVNNNGRPLRVRNPQRLIKLCKHLTAVMDDFKKRV